MEETEVHLGIRFTILVMMAMLMVAVVVVHILTQQLVMMEVKAPKVVSGLNISQQIQT